MKKLISLIITLMLSFSVALPAFAADGEVIYDGDAKEFIFEPGSEHSPTDLFPNFKGVMPGDSLTQKITVRNDASNEVKVKIYLRSLGAHEDSVEFLSQLGLRVQKSEENEMAYMFDAAASETAQLTDWILLGTLYSGGEVNLDVILDVPVELGNEFQEAIGYLDWEFMVEEFPIEEDDPTPPDTGDDSEMILWSSLMGGAVLVMLILIVLMVKRKRECSGTESAESGLKERITRI